MTQSCLLNFYLEATEAKRLSLVPKVMKRNHIQPFARGIMDNIYLYKTQPQFLAFSEQVLKDATPAALPIIKEMATVLINTIYGLKGESIIPQSQLKIEIVRDNTTFCRDPRYDVNLLLSLSFGAKNSIHFLPFIENMPIDKDIISLPLEDGCAFVLSEEASGRIQSEGHCVRVAYGEDAVDKLYRQFEDVNRLIPKLISCKVENLRKLGYTDLKHWCSHPEHVYIGRKSIVFIEDPVTNKKRRFPDIDSEYADNTSSLREYQRQLEQKIESGEINVFNLSGKTMGSWDHPDKKCHGEILIQEYIRRAYLKTFFL